MKKKLFILSIATPMLILTGCNLLNKNNVYGCSDCVYSYSDDVIKIGDIITEYNSDSSSIDNNFFLGYKLDKDNRIINGYVCGKEKEKIFCIEGNYNGSKYKENKEILNKVYNKEKCKETTFENNSFYSCSGEININISETNTNYVSSSKKDQCYVNADGKMYCNVHN